MDHLPMSCALAVALAAAQSACGGPSLAEQCQSACRHLYEDCLTGNACSECVKYPEDKAGEAACESDCDTRPSICRDAGALYACLSAADCSPPFTELLTGCNSAGECVSLTGEDGGPSASLAIWNDTGEDLDGTLESSPGGTVEIEWVGAAGETPFCQGEVEGLPAAELWVLSPGTTPLGIPGAFAAADDDAGCHAECAVCPPDGGFCTGVWLGNGQYWQWVPAGGTLEILQVSALHVVGNFSATRELADGGSAMLQGSFDAPRGCLYTPDVPEKCESLVCPSYNCATGGSQLGATWAIALLALWRRGKPS